MAFFGLTVLGPHPFTSLEANNTTLHLFNENDVKLAWKKSGGGGKVVQVLKYGLLLKILAHTAVSFCTTDALPIESLHQFVKQLYFPNPNNGSSPPISELMRLKELVQSDVSDGRISWVSAEYFMHLRYRSCISKCTSINRLHCVKYLTKSKRKH